MRLKKITKCSDSTIKRKVKESVLKGGLISKFQFDNSLIKYEFKFLFRDLFNRSETKVQEISVFLGPDQDKKAFKRAFQSFQNQYFQFIKNKQEEEK